MKRIFLFASIIIASGLLLTNIYTSLIDARSWGADIPNSIGAAREYYKVVTPGNFFRIFSPLNQLLAAIAFIIFWKSVTSVRLYLGCALVLYILVDVFTFGYFYPRNDIMFGDTLLTDVDSLKLAWSEWNNMNWVRSFILFVGISLSFIGLHKIYTQNRPTN